MGHLDEVLFTGISPDQRLEIPIKFFEPKPFPVPSRSLSQFHRRIASALKIQKVFRGFLVRRSVKKLIAIKRDVDEVEMMISDGKMFDWILIDRKEGLRVMETLMNLLFELDSVPGVNSDVRDGRKSVATRAISLQEIVDAAIPPVHLTETRTSGEREDDSQRNSESAAQTLESIATDEQYSVGQIDESDGFNSENFSQCSSSYEDEGAGICDHDDENSEDNEVGNFIMVRDEDDLGTGDEEEDDDVVDESLQESLDATRVKETLTEGGAVMEKDASISTVEELEVEFLLEIIDELRENHRRQTKILNSLTRRVHQLESIYRRKRPRSSN